MVVCSQATEGRASASRNNAATSAVARSVIGDPNFDDDTDGNATHGGFSIGAPVIGNASTHDAAAGINATGFGRGIGVVAIGNASNHDVTTGFTATEIRFAAACSANRTDTADACSTNRWTAGAGLVSTRGAEFSDRNRQHDEPRK